MTAAAAPPLVTSADIADAQRTLRGDGGVLRTPLMLCPPLPATRGMQVHLKLECAQTAGSFHVRGALFKARKAVAAYKRPASPAANAPLVPAAAVARGAAAAHAAAHVAEEAGAQMDIALPAAASDDLVTALQRRPGVRCTRAAAPAAPTAAAGHHIVLTPGDVADDDVDTIAGHATCGLELMEQAGAWGAASPEGHAVATPLDLGDRDPLSWSLRSSDSRAAHSPAAAAHHHLGAVKAQSMGDLSAASPSPVRAAATSPSPADAALPYGSAGSDGAATPQLAPAKLPRALSGALMTPQEAGELDRLKQKMWAGAVLGRLRLKIGGGSPLSAPATPGAAAVDEVYVPAAGGLAAGVAAAVKLCGPRPAPRVIAVRTERPPTPTDRDGDEHLRRYADRVDVVGTGALCDAVRYLHECGVVSDCAGAAAIAACLRAAAAAPPDAPPKKVVCVVASRSFDPAAYADILRPPAPPLPVVRPIGSGQPVSVSL
eukprot:TRINITY_DN4263_c0_g2_i1.p1 TRINITY_DN4263_c0_g2~~TRINITY_DN4263_c0_g2_i1.p1  ORF type:complete len:488 (+),score=171.58 TRINITY_DN4263_c0_g2_i1:59-1522(+)